jgi:transcriptional regulator with XRE-family HTH domain
MNEKPHIKQIAKRAGMSLSGLSNLLAGRRRPSWRSAKRLAAVTDTDPVLWLEGSPGEIKTAIFQKPNTLTIK